MKPRDIHIAFGLMDISGEYYKNIATVMVEIFSHTDAHVHMHVFHDNTLNIEKINILTNLVKRFNGNVSFYDLTEEDELSDIGRLALNKGMLYRLYIVKYCKNIDKIIYLDGDVFVMGNIQELWNQDIKDYYMAVVLDIKYTRETYIKTKYYKKIGIDSTKYFNSGVLLLNLARVRQESDLITRLKIFSRKFPFCKMLDQDFLNFEFQNKVLFLPKRYNYIPYNIDEVDEKVANKQLILHFAGPFKPWNCKNPFIIRYFCTAYSQISEGRIADIIDYMSAGPQRNFNRLGLKHSLLQHEKNFITSIACFVKAVLPNRYYADFANFIMIKLRTKILYSFYYIYIR